MDIKVVRIFNTYGPRMRPDDGRVVSNFIIQAMRSTDITIYGDGSQTRSFCYVDDMIEGMIRMMDYETGEYGRETDYTLPNLSGFPGPLNLGNPYEVTIRTLAEKIIEILGSESQLVFEPLPEDDPRRRCPDIAKARGIIAWEPHVAFEEGLQKTVDHCLKYEK